MDILVKWDEIKSDSNNDTVRTMLCNILKDNNRKKKVVVFVGSAISAFYPSCLMSASQMRKMTIDWLCQNNEYIEILNKEGFVEELKLVFDNNENNYRPEMIYGAINGFVGKNKALLPLNCLNSTTPNACHKVIAELLIQNKIDHVITTNFDTLVEQCLPVDSNAKISNIRSKILKIHGSLDKPDTIVTTLNHLGQLTFYPVSIDILRKLLDDSHVLFVGYGANDPDLIPILMSAKMASVFWCFYNIDDFSKNYNNNEPWNSIRNNLKSDGNELLCFGGDLYEKVLKPIAANILSIDVENIVGKCPESIHRPPKNWLTGAEKVLTLLQSLYGVAMCYNLKIRFNAISDKNNEDKKCNSEEKVCEKCAYKPEKIWMLIKRISDSISKNANKLELRLKRDFDAFYAEACLKLVNLELDKNNNKLNSHIQDLTVDAKNHLKPYLNENFNDVTQIQVLLNAVTILTWLASGRDQIGALRNIAGAQLLIDKAIAICNKIPSENSFILEGRCFVNKAGILVNEGKIEEAVILCKQAVDSFMNAGDLFGYIQTCINLFNLFNKKKQYEEAKHYYQKSAETLLLFPNAELEQELAIAKKKLDEINFQTPSNRSLIMECNIKTGQAIGQGFRVINVRKRTVGSLMSNPIIDFIEIQMDCMYENAAFLHKATFLNGPPPIDQWKQISFTGNEQICGTWTPYKLQGEFVAIAYRRQVQGQLMAVTNIITAKNDSLISAQLLWYGFPIINTFYVGFKPGMRERTEELLLNSISLL